MDVFEIKNQIDANNAKIAEKVNPAFFALNKEVRDLMAKNKELQAQCTHEFENHVCKWCGKKEN